MTTWKLKLTPPQGPATEKTGLTPEQTLEALTGLVYGTYDAAPAPAEQRDEHLPLAA